MPKAVQRKSKACRDLRELRNLEKRKLKNMKIICDAKASELFRHLVDYDNHAANLRRYREQIAASRVHYIRNMRTLLAVMNVPKNWKFCPSMHASLCWNKLCNWRRSPGLNAWDLMHFDTTARSEYGVFIFKTVELRDVGCMRWEFTLCMRCLASNPYKFVDVLFNLNAYTWPMFPVAVDKRHVWYPSMTTEANAHDRLMDYIDRKPQITREKDPLNIGSFVEPKGLEKFRNECPSDDSDDEFSDFSVRSANAMSVENMAHNRCPVKDVVWKYGGQWITLKDLYAPPQLPESDIDI